MAKREIVLRVVIIATYAHTAYRRKKHSYYFKEGETFIRIAINTGSAFDLREKITMRVEKFLARFLQKVPKVSRLEVSFQLLPGDKRYHTHLY